MLLRIDHETRLTYSSQVTETVFEVRMAPPSTEDQTVLNHTLTTTPQAAVLGYRDGFQNRVELFNITFPYHELILKASNVVRTHRRPAARLLEGVSWPLAGTLAIDAFEYLQPSALAPDSPALDEFVAGLHPLEGTLFSVVERLMAAVRGRLIYEKQVTNHRTPLTEALALGRGVCQDFAHLFLGSCRKLGLPARYVSGYVHHPGELATHAWCQIWAGPEIGWLDVDPTSNTFVGDDHVVVAVGRDYRDVPPNRGVWKGQAEETIAVVVAIEPIDRVPVESSDWAQSGVRPVASRRRPRRTPLRRGGFIAYPTQRQARQGLHKQQAEQQQQ